MPVVVASPRHRSRKSLGAWYTPAPIVRGLLDLALNPAIDAARASDDPLASLLALRVLDPSCGDGAFLVPATERLIAAAEQLGAPDLARDIVERCVVGMDIDPSAARRCAERLRDLAPRASARVIVADALRAGPGIVEDERFDVVVGNPPYLNQLETITANSRETAARVRDWSRGVVKGYADSAAAFWLLSVMVLKDGGRCALLLPRSVLSTRDGAPVRTEVLRRASLESIWFDDAPMFDASVRVCAPVVRAAAQPGRVDRWIGESFEPIDACGAPRSSQWSRVLPHATDTPELPRFDQTLGEIANATADFRDQYYGLDGFIVEDADARATCAGDELERRFPRLVTSGLIDRDACLWGLRRTRILKRTWSAPRLDRERFERETRLGPWLCARLVPKVLLATQTRVLEPLLDAEGVLVPCVPVVTVTPRPGDPDPGATLRRIHRALLAPAATAFAMREYAGAALSPDAIKLAAKQALTLPVFDARPAPELDAWFARRLAR